MSSQLALGSALYSRLCGTALGTLTAGGTASPSVFFEQAPDNQSTPYVVFLYPSELDNNQQSRRLKDVVVRVYGVANSPAVAGSLDSAIDTLLHRKALTMTGWTNLQLIRENGYQLVSTSESGIRYYTSGADYRAEITTT